MLTETENLQDCAASHADAIAAMRKRLTVIGEHRIFAGDCIDIMAALKYGRPVDSIVTDPPYHLASIVKRFGGDDAAPTKATGAYKRAAAGFMGQKWDGGDIAFRPETWRACFDMLKPGGHLIAFCGTRTYHRMACAIEDAGFEIRDSLCWHYGSGFPKSQNISAAIDRAAGAEREVVGSKVGLPGYSLAESKGANLYGGGIGGSGNPHKECEITAPATPEARQWEGWGTALKPATELICLARKPLSEPTIAANVLKHGTGGLNIDGCRVGSAGARNNGRRQDSAIYGKFGPTDRVDYGKGRFPANLIHDGSPEVMGVFPDEEARFFYQAKAQNSERVFQCRECGGRWHGKAECGHKDIRSHPTVKPVALMRHLVRLVTPPGGTVLDPFAGTGTTGAACVLEGFHSVLIEREPDHVGDIVFRLQNMTAAPVSETAVTSAGRQGVLF